VIYAALDNKPLALEWLQDAYDNHEMEIPWLISEPQFYSLHEEPAFQELVEKVGFPKTGSELTGRDGSIDPLAPVRLNLTHIV
jgi:hypothetical protein